jgi:alpha-mannosidase
VSEIRAAGTYRRKYPTGEWMVSPQVFETIHRPFTALQLLDFDLGERGLLYLHDGSQAFFREDAGVSHLLSMYDAWDGDYFYDRVEVRVRVVPHGPLTHARRWQLAQEFTRPALVAGRHTAREAAAGAALPASLAGATCDAPNVLITALYREAEIAGQHAADYAGGALGEPYLLRLVEFDGQSAAARLTLPGEVAAAWKTNLLGRAEEPLAVMAVPPGEAQMTVRLRPFEIATVYIDLVPGRKQPRFLDAYRHVWATVHQRT